MASEWMNQQLAAERLEIPEQYSSDLRFELWRYYRDHVAVISTRNTYRIDRLNLILKQNIEEISKAYNPFELIDSLYKDSLQADVDYGVLRSNDLNLTYAEEHLEDEEPDMFVTPDKILVTKEEFEAAFYDGKRGNELIDRYVKLSFTSPVLNQQPTIKDRFWRWKWRVRLWWRYRLQKWRK